MHVVYDSLQQTIAFRSEIHTPVCLEGVCKPLDVLLYWDLSGAYLGYTTLEGVPLTKFDHDPFTAKDYLQLHTLLCNRYSALDRKTLEELVTSEAPSGERIVFNGMEVEAISGATVKEIQEEVVHGALYSCYSLWHLVYGQAVTSIKEHVAKNATERFVVQLLDAEWSHYWEYAVRLMDDTLIQRHPVRLAAVFQKCSPLVRKRILQKASSDHAELSDLERRLIGLFEEVDVNTRTLLIRRAIKSGAPGLLALKEGMNAMTKNQLEMYLKAAEALEPNSRQPIVTHGIKLRANSESNHTYVLQQFLNKYE